MKKLAVLNLVLVLSLLLGTAAFAQEGDFGVIQRTAEAALDGWKPVIPADAHLRIIVGVVSHDGWLCFGITGDGVHAGDVDVLRDGALRALADDS